MRMEETELFRWKSGQDCQTMGTKISDIEVIKYIFTLYI